MVEHSPYYPNVKGLSLAAPAALAGNEIEEYENNRVGTGEQW